MNTRTFPITRRAWVFATFALLLASSPAALTAEPPALPAPEQSGGLPLMQALRNRKTTRDFRPDPLTPRQLS